MSVSFHANWIPKGLLIAGDPADAASRNYFSHGDLYTTVRSVAARNVFTTVFVILNILTGVVGVYLLEWRNTAKLLKKGPRGRSVPLYTLSPWMSAADTIIYTWDTHHLPGGHYGLFMLTTGIFGIVHQYFTSSFISSVPGIYGDCTFNNGVVFLPEFTNLVEPESSWPAADIAIISQEWSTVHGYNRGIYAKSNSDSNFTVTADSPDYLGNWTCTEDKSVTFSADTSIDTINSTLTQNQFLYANSRGVWHTIPGLPDTQDGLLMWSSSDPTESGRKWDVKASIAPSHDVGQPIVMSNFDCTMTGPQIEWILPLIPSVDTLDDWGSRTYGYLVQGSDYSNPGDDSTFGFGLEVMLNAMTMVAGTLNTATRSANGAYNSPSTYRCKLERTIICKEVFAMLGFLLLHLFCFVLLSIKYWFQIHTSDRARRKAIKEVPSSASSWQVAVLRDHFPDQASYITAKDISQYRYGWDANGSNVLRFTRKGAEGEHVEEISYVPKMDPNMSNTYVPNMPIQYGPAAPIQYVPMAPTQYGVYGH